MYHIDIDVYECILYIHICIHTKEKSKLWNLNIPKQWNFKTQIVITFSMYCCELSCFIFPVFSIFYIALYKKIEFNFSNIVTVSKKIPYPQGKDY